MADKRVVLIPYWVADVCKRKSLTLTDALDYKKLEAVMSKEDIAGFDALQSYADKLCSGLSQLVTFSPFKYEDYKDSGIYFLGSDPSVKSNVEARIFNSEKCDRYTEAFSIHDVSPELLGVVIYPGYFSSSGQSSAGDALMEAMLKSLYAYQPMTEVAKKKLFFNWLGSLSKAFC